MHPLESERETTVAPSSMALRAAYWGNVAGARDCDLFAFERVTVCVFHHLLDVIDSAVTSGFWSDQGTTPAATLAGEHTFPELGLLLVLAEHPANFAGRDTNVTGCAGLALTTHEVQNLETTYQARQCQHRCAYQARS